MISSVDKQLILQVLRRVEILAGRLLAVTPALKLKIRLTLVNLVTILAI